MLAKFRSAVSKSRRRQRKLDRRRALHRSLRPEPLEGRLLLSGDSWVVPTETPFSGSYTSEVDTDSSGNVYLATSVDGGAATGADLFLAKYLPSGVEDWSHSFPVPDNQAVWTATVGSDGFYVTGGFMGTMDFDPTEGEAVLSESAGRYYLAKYSLAGEFRWVRQFDANMRIQGLAAQDGDVYAVGNSGGTNDPFSIAKVSGDDGELCWTKTLGTGVPSALALYRPDGGPTHIYVAGATYISRKVPSSGFVMELSESVDGSDSSIAWDRDLGQDFRNAGSHIAVREEEIGGSLEPRIYVPSMSTGMLLKLDALGNTVWLQQVIHDDLIHFNDVALEGSTVYLAGSFLQSVDFDPNAADATLISRGDRDGFIARYDSQDGHLAVVQRVGGGGFDSLQTLALADGWLLASGVASPPSAAFLASEKDASGQIQMSAFVPVSPNELFTMRLDTAAPIVHVAGTDITAAGNTPVTLNATTSAEDIVWYEAGQLLGSGAELTVTLESGTHQISAIATDAEGRIGMAGVVVTVAPPAILTINDVSKSEGKRGTTTFTFTVTRGGDTSGSVTVDYATEDGTAESGSDYYATSGTLAFAAGVTSQTINVSVIGDRTAEYTETFFVNLSNAVGGTIAEDQGVGTGTIVNDDGEPLMAVFGEQGSAALLTMAQVQQLAPLAVTLWQGQSHLAVPSDLRFEIDDLPSGQLGEAFQHTITLDTNANGAGWYVDRAVPTANQVDLLTVLSHEIGHVLGYEHSTDSDDLMAAALPLGMRRLPWSVPIIVSATSDWLVTAPLLLAEHRLDTTLPDLVDHSLLASDLERGAGADSNLWLLPLVPAGSVEQPSRTSEAVQAQIVKTMTEEETELLDEDLLELIATSQQ